MRKVLILLAATTVACGGDGEGPVAVATVSVTADPSTNLVVGQTAQITATPKDQAGNPLERPVTFQSDNPTVADVSSTGLVTAASPGTARVTATSEERTGQLTFSVSPAIVGSVTVAPAAVEVAAGGTTTLTATVRDASGVLLPTAQVAWTSSDATKATVVANAGAQTATVSGVAGGAVTITANSSGATGTASVAITTAASPTITAVLPDPLVPGATATITGTNFSATPASNLVTIDGVSATVNTASATALTVTLPTSGFACQPTRNVGVIVSVGGLAGLRSHPFSAAQQRTLAAGQSLRIDNAAQVRCNELSAPGGNGRYIIAVYNITPTGAGTTPFQLRGAGPLPAAPAAAAPMLARRTSGAFADRQEVRERMRERRAHLRLLQANRAFADQQLRAGISFRRGARAAAPAGTGPSFAVNPTVGQNSSVKIPDIDQAAFCSSPVNVTARTVYNGTHAIVIEDNANPSAGSFDSYYQAVGQEMDNAMWTILTTNFGNPIVMDAQLDANSKIVMLFSTKVNDFEAGVAGFVVSCDFFPPNTTNNTASNQGEFFYARAPTSTQSGFPQGVFTADAWRRSMRSTIIHEVKHITSFGQRIAQNAPDFEDTWLEEGTAMHAEELWARTVYGNSWKGNSDYGSTLFCDVRPTFTQCADRPFVMFDHFIFLYDFLNTPEDLSPLGAEAGAEGSTFYGSAWSLVRWAIDTHMPSDESFLKPLTQSTLSGVPNIEARTGRSFAEMLGDWALALATDDLSGFTPDRPALRFLSWNVRDIFSGMNADFPQPENFPLQFPLQPHPLAFGPFSVNKSVRTGSVAYFELSGTSTSKQLVELRSQGGGDPSSVLRIAFVRVQ
ncbi:MAG TPA: Ig-like domain-containing protein [Gemmatimonadaceae bacterium]|nr:Ig-like domain-containing protein [Gemmatimonadaceae bacterium]